jgi:hypothetical protein
VPAIHKRSRSGSLRTSTIELNEAFAAQLLAPATARRQQDERQRRRRGSHPLGYAERTRHDLLYEINAETRGADW